MYLNNIFIILVPIVDILFKVAERTRKQNTSFLLFNPWTYNFTERVSNCIRNGRQLHNNDTYTQCVLVGIFIAFLVDFSP